MHDRFQFLTDRVNDLDELVEEQYNKDSEQIDVQNQRLGVVSKNQLKLQLEWYDILRTAQFILSEIDDELDRQFSLAFIELMEDHSKQLSTTEGKIYANSTREVVETKKLKNRAVEVKDRIDGVVEAINTRKYIIKNLTDMLTHGHEDYLI